MHPTLSRGDQGTDVQLLQRALRDLRYEPGQTDGDFGPITEAALIRYQQDHGLDSIESGICGDATWASLEGQFGNLEGLRTEESVTGYVSDAYGIWNSSMSADDRLAALQAQVNQELTAAGVPYVRFVLDPGTAPYALFDFTVWTAKVEPTPFEPAHAEQLTPEEQSQIAAAVYHEARHAEQWFQIARLLAGLHDLDAAAIHTAMQIPEEVAAQAVADPIRECTLSNGTAFEWYESVYGAGDPERRAVLGSISDADQTNDRWADYRTRLPEESDAWDTGGGVQREWRRYATGDGGTVHLPALRRNSSDTEQVRYLQQLLQWRGHYTGYQLDGDFGPRTEEAVKSFQGANGLEADGVVGVATWEALLP